MAGSKMDLETDRPFELKFWRFQRIAWIVLALFLLVALAGLTGKGGPLSRAVAAGPEGKVEYPRVARWETTDLVTITLPPGTTGEATVEIGDSFSKIFQVEDIQPSPGRSSATGAGQRLVFDLSDPPGAKSISVHVRPLQPALTARTWVRINNGERLALTPVVLP